MCMVTISMRLVVVLLVVVGVVSAVCVYTSVTGVASMDSKYMYTVVVDAGHGGRDVGCSGVNLGVNECDINLSIANKLREYLERQGMRVVMTRLDDSGLYDKDATNFKLSDMNKRVAIINESHADMVVSIHQNSFEDTTLKGAQVFYQEGDSDSKVLAKCVQDELKYTMPYTRGEHNHSDLYLLKESSTLGVLVECGYLTNSEDEVNLANADYQQKIAYTIMCGIVRYLISIGTMMDVY